MRVHLGFTVEEDLLADFAHSLPSNCRVTVGDHPPDDSEILVTGFPPPDTLARLKGLTTVIIPFAGLQPRSREALLPYPGLKVYNLPPWSSDTVK